MHEYSVAVGAEIIKQGHTPGRRAHAKDADQVPQRLAGCRLRRVRLDVVEAERDEPIQVAIGDLGDSGGQRRIDPAPESQAVQIVTEQARQDRTESGRRLANLAGFACAARQSSRIAQSG